MDLGPCARRTCYVSEQGRKKKKSSSTRFSYWSSLALSFLTQKWVDLARGPAACPSSSHAFQWGAGGVGSEPRREQDRNSQTHDWPQQEEDKHSKYFPRQTQTSTDDCNVRPRHKQLSAGSANHGSVSRFYNNFKKKKTKMISPVASQQPGGERANSNHRGHGLAHLGQPLLGLPGWTQRLFRPASRPAGSGN